MLMLMSLFFVGFIVVTGVAMIKCFIEEKRK